MLSAQEIIELFGCLNHELQKTQEIAEVGIVGGAVMCLVFKARPSTRDIDAIFKPSQIVRNLVAKIAEDRNIPKDWLNDAVKGYIQGDFEKIEVLRLSHIRVWAPEPKYMLAMKCISARWDTHDRDDVIFLVNHLKFKKPKQVFDLIQMYYPKNKIPPKTQFFIEEIFERI